MKVNLTEPRAYRGTTYGPGEVEVPDDLASLLAVEAANRQDAAARDLRVRYDAATAERLAASGYADVPAVEAASDDDLLAISGIGPAALKKIRGGG